MTRAEVGLYVECLRDKGGSMFVGGIGESGLGSMMLYSDKAKDCVLGLTVYKTPKYYYMVLVLEGNNEVIIRSFSLSLYQFFTDQVQRLVDIENQ